MQRDKNLGYNLLNRKIGAVYTRRFGLLEVTPDRTPIRPRARIGSNSKLNQ